MTAAAERRSGGPAGTTTRPRCGREHHARATPTSPRDAVGEAAAPGRLEVAGAGVLLEDVALERLELRPGLDAELVHEPAAEIAIHGEGLGLAPARIEGTHELAREPLAKWTVGDERLQLRDELVVVAEREVGIDALLERRQARLFEPACRSLREGLVGDLRQRRAAPEGESLAQACRGVGPVVCFADEPFKPECVHVVGIDAEPVAPARGLDRDVRVVGDQLSQRGDVDVEVGGSPSGRRLPLQRFDQPILRDCPGRVDDHGRQDRPRLSTRHRHDLAVPP